MLGWIKAVLAVGVKIYGFLMKDDKPGLAETLPFAVGQILPAVQKAISYQGLNTKEKFDQWLKVIDTGTGVDEGAVDLISGLPAEKEEILFDHLVEIARIYGYHLIGVEGY